MQWLIVPHLGESIPYLIPDSDLARLGIVSNMLSVASFIMMWAAACILLRQYSLRLGHVRYWILVSVPLIYYLSQVHHNIYELIHTNALVTRVHYVRHYSYYNIPSKYFGRWRSIWDSLLERSKKSRKK